jgi:DNA-binding transcriptional regulator PaaX
MIGQPNLTDKILSFIADLDDSMDYPKSFGQLLNWDKHEYYKNRDRLKAQEKRMRNRLKQAIRNLEKAETITFSNKLKEFKLTPRGWITYAVRYSRHNKQKSKSEKLGKYIIIFDIPEEYRRFRDLFRECLKNLGCQYTQKSVWFTSDKSVWEFAQKIVANCELEGYVKFIKAERIIN